MITILLSRDLFSVLIQTRDVGVFIARQIGVSPNLFIIQRARARTSRIVNATVAVCSNGQSVEQTTDDSDNLTVAVALR